MLILALCLKLWCTLEWSERSVCIDKKLFIVHKTLQKAVVVDPLMKIISANLEFHSCLMWWIVFVGYFI